MLSHEMILCFPSHLLEFIVFDKSVNLLGGQSSDCSIIESAKYTEELVRLWSIHCMQLPPTVYG